MDLSELTGYLAEAEDEGAISLPYGGRIYRVRPPSAPRGLRCVAYVAALGAKDKAERVQGRTVALGGQSLATVALGDGVVQQMEADDVPAPVVERMAFYAALVWARGEDYADEVVKRLWGGDPDPKAKRRPKRRRKGSTGTPTGSAPTTPTPASTRTTGSRPS